MYTEFFHIDSRARFLESPVRSPNNYRFDLPRLLRGVREIELFRAEVPSSMYNITATDTPFVFVVTRLVSNQNPQILPISWQIPPGAYTLTTIVDRLNALKDADPTLLSASLTSHLTFSADHGTGRIALTANNDLAQNVNVRLMFHPYYPFGIDTDVQGIVQGDDCIVTAPQPARFNTPTVLFLSFTNIRALGASTSDIEVHSNLFGHAPGHAEGHVARGCIVARLQLTAGQWNINYLGSENRIYLRTFQTGALNLDHLDIVFTDPLGRLIDFNGADHSLFLRIAYESR
jgi:hypothetical protein